MAGRRHRACVAVTRPGLEAVLATELRDLGLVPRAIEPGAVAFDATDRELYLAVRWARTATRVLLTLGTCRARTFGLLERGLAGIDWGAWVPAGSAVAVRCRAERSRLFHTGALAERLHTAVAAAVPGVTATDQPDAPIRVDVRVVDDVATVRLDATGAPADRRGWRLAVAKAPLPPTVAAAVLRTVGWDGTAPLLDPLCGSGTIPIESALRATGRPSVVDRSFAVQSWADFAPGTWASTGHPPTPATTEATAIVASDRDAGAVAATAANARRAGIADRLVVQQAPISAATADGGPGWVVTNPPWGRRVPGSGDLRDLHAALGALVHRLEGWRLAVVTADPALVAHTGLALDPRWRTQVGGVTVHLLASA